jgi:hypothetical protein
MQWTSRRRYAPPRARHAYCPVSRRMGQVNNGIANFQVFCGRYGEPLSRSSGRACAARAAANRSAPAFALFRSLGQCKAYVLCPHQTPSMRKGLSCSPASRQNRELCSSLRRRWLGLRFAPAALAFKAATAPRWPSANSISRRALSPTSAALRSSL